MLAVPPNNPLSLSCLLPTSDHFLRITLFPYALVVKRKANVRAEYPHSTCPIPTSTSSTRLPFGSPTQFIVIRLVFLSRCVLVTAKRVRASVATIDVPSIDLGEVLVQGGKIRCNIGCQFARGI